MYNKFITLGCRLNTFETEVIKEQLEKHGVENTVVINTCAVTAKAEKESLKAVEEACQRHPGSRVIVTGCAIHTAANGLKHLDKVYCVRNDQKLDIGTLLSSNKVSSQIENNTRASATTLHNQDCSCSAASPAKEGQNLGNKTCCSHSGYNSDVETVKSSELAVTPTHKPTETENPTSLAIPRLNNFQKHTRAFVQIQQGCDHRCSFCIVHKSRGKSVSLTDADIVSQINILAQQGYKEVTLTGVDISSWQRNIFHGEPSKLGKLCTLILNNTPLLRLRLSSLDPAVEDPMLLDLLTTEPRFMPHLHFSLQSMDNGVLSNMGRRHTNESARLWLSSLKAANPNLTLGADLIAGFPKETELQFENTLQSVKELNIEFLHVFPYSERPGTPAALFKQIPPQVRKERARKLIELGNSIKIEHFKKQVGKTVKVLLEKDGYGHAEDYSRVKIDNPPPRNSIANVRINSYSNLYLMGELSNV